MEKKRSIGVIIFGFLVILKGGIHVYNALPTVIYAAKKAISILAPYKEIIEDKIAIHSLYILLGIGIFSLIICVYEIICGIGILKFRNWARISIIVFSIIFLCFQILKAISRLLNPKQNYEFYFIPWIIFEAFILYFFTRPKVKEQFK